MSYNLETVQDRIYVTINDLERRNGRYFTFFSTEFGTYLGWLRKSG